MNDDYERGLSITTSLTRAIEAYSLTLWHRGKSNSFLRDWRIEFYTPRYHQAILSSRHPAPEGKWFSLFDEAEKEMMEDEYRFYGVMYRTTVKLARKRVRNLLEKVEKSLAETPFIPSTNQSWEFRQPFYRRDEIRDIDEALELFGQDDEICLTFYLEKWPEMDEMRKKEYVKDYKEKLFLKVTNRDEDIPF